MIYIAQIIIISLYIISHMKYATYQPAISNILGSNWDLLETRGHGPRLNCSTGEVHVEGPEKDEGTRVLGYDDAPQSPEF